MVKETEENETANRFTWVNPGADNDSLFFGLIIWICDCKDRDGKTCDRMTEHFSFVG